FYATAAEAKVMEERFGAVLAQDLLNGRVAARGKELRSWTCPILPGEQMEGYAQELAARLATKPQKALGLLKQHLVRHLVGLVQELKQVEVEAASATPVRGQSSATMAEEILLPAEHIHVETRA